MDNHEQLAAKSAQRLANLITYHESLAPRLSWYEIINRAISLIQPDHANVHHYEEDYDDAARAGYKLFLSLTRHDGLAKARLAKARRDFASAIKEIQNHKEVRKLLKDGEFRGHNT